MRDFLGNYIVTKFNNRNSDSDGNLLTNITTAFDVNNSEITYSTSNTSSHF